MLGRRLVVTRKGYLGAAPRSAQVGDGVYVLAGGHVPFVLRRDQSGGSAPSTFWLVGDCYVHGLMHGEALRWEGSRWEDVRLV
ncbi:hypothetical protein B0T26DRAFT_650377 [Lasiosphaeria miniovina]|uniref:Uncharacterized protein n=1 Tax=Lasiosphaeria miniovina TaxID=1954250 RepID=A0AA40AE21_9PEZI|nr:uncharacterized protein B0T26DRAFT_650377 [Lasiosphaeria miniovina]KAK0714092.1 hypothetical protein B0T26DRAFT_650377 [Lasiosphaeria miniovina]